MTKSLTTPTLNITRLTEQLWTGGDLPEGLTEAVSHIKAWHNLGIRTIIDNRFEWNDADVVAAVEPEITYLHAGVGDAGQRMPDWWFDGVTAFAQDAIDAGHGVLLHCHMGINRGPSAAFAVLLATGWDPVAAIDLIRANRPIAAVGYAEDALDWWQRKADLPTSERIVQRNALRRWRQGNPHDTVRLIRQIRAAERER